MKVGVLTVAYNEQRFIGACIKQFKRFNLPHLVLVSAEPWHGPSYQPDGTVDIATSLGAEVICGQWESEAKQRNYGLNHFSDFDWVLIVDADEFYTHDGLSELSASLETNADAVVAPNMAVYWKTVDYRVNPDQEDSPIVAIRPHKHFLEARQAFVSQVDTKAQLHHLSYVRTDAEMSKKISSFEHAVDFDTERWFNEVWLNWLPGNTNLHPVNPTQFASVSYNPLPTEIQELFS